MTTKNFAGWRRRTYRRNPEAIAVTQRETQLRQIFRASGFAVRHSPNIWTHLRIYREEWICSVWFDEAAAAWRAGESKLPAAKQEVEELLAQLNQGALCR